MADGGHAANGKAGLCADEGGVRFAEGFTCEIGRFGRVHAVATCSEEQDGVAGCFAAKNDRFGDLIHMAALGLGGLFGGMRVDCGFHDGDVETEVLGVALDAFHAFAHGGVLRRNGWRCKGG